MPQEDPGNTGNRIEFNLRFPGQYFDRETGLHYNYHRTYDPNTGRYVESDPIGLVGGLNTFAYAYNSPTMYTDPTGLFVNENNAYLAPAAVAASVAAPVAAVAGAAALAGVVTYRACHPDDKDKCKKLLDDIYKSMNEIEGRLSDLYLDRHNQFNLAYDKPNPSLPTQTTYKGHRQQAGNQQTKLRNLIDEANKLGCKVPPYARQLAYAPIPTRPALP